MLAKSKWESIRIINIAFKKIIIAIWIKRYSTLIIRLIGGY